MHPHPTPSAMHRSSARASNSMSAATSSTLPPGNAADPSSLGGPPVVSNAEAEALAKDSRSNKNSELLRWVHRAQWDPQAKDQRKTQAMPGSKAHLPWAYVTIPQIPKTLAAFKNLRQRIGDGPEGAVATYCIAMLVFSNVDKDIGRQCLVLATDLANLISKSGPGTVNGYGLPSTSFLKRLEAHPSIARCLLMFSTKANRYDPTRDGKKMILKIRDCSVVETSGDTANRAVWKEVSKLPAGFKLRRRNGVWKVSAPNPMCYPPEPKDESSSDDDDGPESAVKYVDPTLLTTPCIGIPNAKPKHEKAALEKDPRSNKNSALLTWCHHARFDPQSRNQPKKQPMRGSKAHLPWAYVHIPSIPNTVEDFLDIRKRLGDGPEAAAALYALAMLVFTQNRDVGLQCMVVASHKKCLKKAPAGGPHTYKGYELDLKGNRLRSMFFDRLQKHPTIAWSLLWRATRENRYDPRTEGRKLFYKIRDCHVSETKGDVCKRAVWKYYAKLPAGMQLGRNTRGVWKVIECNSLCYPPAPKPMPVEDDGDDI